ncbi:MAG TPA: divalent metal cation transporter [Candidatus Acidoferrales bacterium]|nr:divalent metal cation transporter [Candidatus Acidoferrales bacterium]
MNSGEVHTRRSSRQTRNVSSSNLSLLRKLKTLFYSAGPGLITGASDDDPSGIATYAQGGAQFGYGVLWLTLFSFPLMCAIQEVSARLGRITGAGIAAGMSKAFPRWIVISVVTCVFVATIFNLGADLGAMADVLHTLVHGPQWIHLIWIAALSAALQVFMHYRQYVKYLKFLALALLAYVITAFLTRTDWASALLATIAPPVRSFTDGYVAIAVAVLGTTITPYLFFWQSSQEVEELQTHARQKALIEAPEQAEGQFRRIREDTYSGMAASNLVAFFIMLTTASTIHLQGITKIQTAMQAAQALKPLAGRFAYLLFAAGIIGTGALALPVMAGSAAFALAELMRWRAGLQYKPRRALPFNATIVAAMAIGVTLNFVHLNPIRALVIAAVINGIVAAPVMAATMLLAGNRKIVGDFKLPRYLFIGGWIATAVMGAASALFLEQMIF